MTGDLKSLHSYLRTLLPARDSEIMQECRDQHRFNPNGSQGLPADAVALASSLRALQRSGLLEQREGLWYWKAEPAKVEQAKLFA